MAKKIKNDKGFTLMEMLIVIGLVAVVMSLSMFVDLNNYRGDAFRSEINTLGISLQTARADSMNNIDQKKHGVAIHPSGYDGYVIFEGNTYATRDVLKDVNVKASYEATLSSGSLTEVVFDQLSGDAVDGDIVLKDEERNMTATININHEGKISF